MVMFPRSGDDYQRGMAVPQMTSLVTVVDGTIDQLAATYGELPDVLKTADPRLLKAALKKAKGNMHFLTAEPDGSIIIWNRPVW